jgi:hypothetical protein
MPSAHEHQLIAKILELPPDRVAEVENFVDFLKQREQMKARRPIDDSLNFPVDNVGPWPETFSTSREDLYNDEGR